MWLLTKGESLKAQRTLGKLRGWPSQETCSSKEFKEMIAYTSSVVYDEDDNETGKCLFKKKTIIKPSAKTRTR